MGCIGRHLNCMKYAISPTILNVKNISLYFVLFVNFIISVYSYTLPPWLSESFYSRFCYMRILILFLGLICSAMAHDCQDLCDELDSCAFSPKAQGSYCKDWQEIHVCFGLYFTDETLTDICYQPNDRFCREDFPVPCPVH